MLQVTSPRTYSTSTNVLGWNYIQDMMFLIKLLKEPASNFDYISFSSSSTCLESSCKLKFNLCKSNLSRHYVLLLIVLCTYGTLTLRTALVFPVHIANSTMAFEVCQHFVLFFFFFGLPVFFPSFVVKSLDTHS